MLEFVYYNLFRLFFLTSTFFLSTITFADPSSPFGFLALGEVEAGGAMSLAPTINPFSGQLSLLAELWVRGVWLTGSVDVPLTLVDSAIGNFLGFGFIACMLVISLFTHKWEKLDQNLCCPTFFLFLFGWCLCDIMKTQWSCK